MCALAFLVQARVFRTRVWQYLSRAGEGPGGAHSSGRACPQSSSVEADRDRDGVPDTEDLCPDIQNADQEDADADGAGDACGASLFGQPRVGGLISAAIWPASSR